eukprot:gene3334-biopygen685
MAPPPPVTGIFWAETSAAAHTGIGYLGRSELQQPQAPRASRRGWRGRRRHTWHGTTRSWAARCCPTVHPTACNPARACAARCGRAWRPCRQAMCSTAATRARRATRRAQVRRGCCRA